MPVPAQFVEISGSHRSPLSDAQSTGEVAADERFEVTVCVRRRRALSAEVPHALGGHRPREEFAAEHGADPQDLARVAAFAAQYGLAVVEQSAARRSVILSGTAGQFSQAFQVELRRYEHAHGTYRGRTGPVHVPAEYAEVIEGVFGLDNRPFARPHFQIGARGQGAGTRGQESADRGLGLAARALPANGYSPIDVARIYNFPKGINGAGQCIGIIELGGGYRPRDLTTYFAGVGLPTPTVVPVGVGQGRNAPAGSPDSADGEVLLDIEVAGAVAPGARLAVYFAADASDKSFLDALTTAIHDNVNRPSIVSISWGGPEDETTPSFVTQFNQTLLSAAHLGVTVCVAAGDNGAADMGPDEWDGSAHVDFPASSPYALACGGTRINGTGSGGPSESAWNQNFTDQQSDSFGATGGGISDVFAVPAWQSHLVLPASANAGSGPGRGVPDVAGDADPASGYRILVDGQVLVMGGTSAVAPLWAGLIALVNQKRGTALGYANPWLYTHTAGGVFREVLRGNNMVGPAQVGYACGPGWNACTGLGTPNGAALLAALEG
jgi:kumamolisin